MPTSQYYGRVKVGGKLVRRSLDTDVFETARLRLSDFLTQERSKVRAPAGVPTTFAEAMAKFQEELSVRHDLKPRTKEYTTACLKVLLKTWPQLEHLELSSISKQDCEAWATRFLKQGYDEHYFNQTLSGLKRILDLGMLNHNPARQVKRRGVKASPPKLPDRDQFRRLLENMEQGGGRDSKNCADLVRLLAFTGCRLSEAAGLTWADVDWKHGVVRVLNAKQRLSSSAPPTREVPFNPDLEKLLKRLFARAPQPSEHVCAVRECQKSLTRACAAIGIARFTHHSLRHLFATRAIESGIDIPTISRWLGHVDGGALLMRTYGHLQRDHSIAMGKLVQIS